MFPLRVIAASALIVFVSVDGETMSGGNFSLAGSITGGGGSSQGGTFQLLGEIARPILGESSGGTFTLQTPPLGFDSIPVGDFELEIVRSGSSVTLSWPAEASSYVLEFSPSLGSSAIWDTVQGAAGQNSISIQATGAAQFFRLRGLAR